MMFNKVEGKEYEDYDPEIIAWQREEKNDFRNLIYKFPQQGDNIKEKKYFAIKDYEKAIFYNKGEMVGVLGGGVYELDKKAKIKGTELIYFDISLVNLQWGIPLSHGIPAKDGITIGLHGDLKIKINDVKTFYQDVIAGSANYSKKELKKWIKSLLHTSLRDIFKNYNAKDIILEDRERVINLVISKITDEFLKYGLELESFNIIGIQPPEDMRDLFEKAKEKLKVITNQDKSKLNKLIEDSKKLENRVKELTEKLHKQQDLLIDGQITQEEYNKKKTQIEKFIEETKNKLNEIDTRLKQQ